MAGFITNNSPTGYTRTDQTTSKSVSDLPIKRSVSGVKAFAPGAKVAVDRAAGTLIVADSSYLTMYRVEVDGAAVHADQMGRWKTGFQIAGVALEGGAIVAAADGRIFKVDRDEGLIPPVNLSAPISSIGQSASFYVIALAERVIAIDIHSNREVYSDTFRRPFRVKTRSDRDSVVVIERGHRQVHTID